MASLAGQAPQKRPERRVAEARRPGLLLLCQKSSKVHNEIELFLFFSFFPTPGRSS